MGQLNRFDWIATHYDKLNKLVFGKNLLEAQHHFLHHVRGKRVLVLGGGSGELLHALLKAQPEKVMFIEASKKMIALAQGQIRSDNLIYEHGTEDSVSGVYDVIITNFFLDLFTEEQLSGVIAKLTRHLKEQGLWLITDFQTTNRWHHRMLLKTMYIFFRISGSIDAATLPDWKKLLMAQNFELNSQCFFMDKFVVAQVFQRRNY